MKGIGLVFAGGGGKGAYEIGVWKYLHEIGLDQYVRAVSGTSVGALNAALFAGSTYEIAENLWMNIDPGKILSPKEVKAEDVIKFFAATGIAFSGPIQGAIEKISSEVLAKTAMGAEHIAQMLLIKMRSDYLFSRSGIKELINDGMNFESLRNNDISCFATCLKYPTLDVERFKLNEYRDDEITKILLASSAIPIVFPNEEFQGNRYCDGGVPIVGDNVPIAPVYDMGIEYIFVVHLKQDTIIEKEKYLGAKIIEIVPSIDLGDALTGTLDFTSDGASERINQGYEDAKRVLQPMVEMLVLNAENQIMLKNSKKKMKEFEEKKKKLLATEKIISDEKENDEFDNLFNKLMQEK